MNTEMLTWLREYIANTPPEEKRKDWQQVEQMNLKGPKAYEYLELLKINSCEEFPTTRVQNLSKYDPSISGVFFLTTNQFETHDYGRVLI